MKNTFRFEFHVLYYLVGLFCFLMGYFKDFIWISLIIMIHELGHVTGAILNNWKIDKVVILPFGGMTLLSEQLNRPIVQEWGIVLLGPLYQMLFWWILCILNYTNPTFTMYHFLLLGFNLIPVIPLDGSKMLQLLLERFFSYKRAKYVGLWISLFLLLLLVGYAIDSKNIILGVILLFIAKENWNFYHTIPYQMDKFLLERYLHHFSFSKIKKVKGIQLEKMKRGYTHLFWVKGKWNTEQDVLQNYYNSITKNLINKY